MGRRRLRLSSFSDEEDEQEPPTATSVQLEEEEEHMVIEINSQEQELTGSPQPPNDNPNSGAPVPFTISDEEFIDASDTLTTPSPQPAPAPGNSSNQPSPPAPPPSTGCPIGDFLFNMGLNLKRDWLSSCLRGLENSVGGVNSADVAAIAKLCFGHFLFSDMNHCGAGVLPPNVDSMHLFDLPGPFILQVDEVVNISSPLKGRYQDAQPGHKRCLKLSMTDGVQRVFGMEYRPIKDLKVFAPAGFKVAICNVHIRHGLLMLVPEALVVLGGVVDELEAARQRLVNEVNKPPRGRRSRTGVVPPLATRATMAAWPPNAVNVPETTRSANVSEITRSANVPETTRSANVPETTRAANVLQHGNGSVNVNIHHNSTINLPRRTDSSNLQGADLVATVNVNYQSTTEEFSVPVSADESMLNPSSSTFASGIAEMRIDAPVSSENVVSNQHSSAVSNNEDSHMVEEFDHPLILAGSQESPFTYLASLSAKWAAVKEKEPSVQGKVKGFLTGVKGFLYKQRATYELQVYIDDGSLISEILIDHNVVQKGIGYSPEEVTAALSSPDKKRASDMKEILKRFQVFLANFEGTMLIEINGISPLPVALEMNQGCPASDAWLLMKRLKFFATSPTPQHHMPDPIDLTP